MRYARPRHNPADQGSLVKVISGAVVLAAAFPCSKGHPHCCNIGSTYRPWRREFCGYIMHLQRYVHIQQCHGDTSLNSRVYARIAALLAVRTGHTAVFLTLTDRASTILSNIRGCQSGTWSQRGTKVNGSHHGDNPLLRPTGIQIATKCNATLHAMAPTNNKTVHQTSFTPYREQPRSTRIVVAYPRPAFSATNRTHVPTSFDQQ